MIECVFCHATVADHEEAIDCGWEPCWHALTGPDGSPEQYDSPVCGTCLHDNFDWDGPDGDPILKPGRELLLEDGDQQ